MTTVNYPVLEFPRTRRSTFVYDDSDDHDHTA